MTSRCTRSRSRSRSPSCCCPTRTSWSRFAMRTRRTAFTSTSNLDPSVLVVDAIFLVFRADVLENVAVGNQRQRGLETERAGVIRRVVEGHLRVHVAKVTPAIAFGDAHRGASRVSEAVQPGALIESGRFDDERIGL